jgi:hypothetical protein
MRVCYKPECCVCCAGGGHKASAEALQQAIEEKYGDKYKVQYAY